MTILKFKLDPRGGDALVAEVPAQMNNGRATLRCTLTRASAIHPATVTVVFLGRDAFEIERVQVPSVTDAAEIACFIVDRFLAGLTRPEVWAPSWRES